MRPLVASVLCWVVISTVGYAASLYQREVLLFNLGDQRLGEYWTQQRLDASWAGTAIVQFVPKGQSLTDWRELLTIQSFQIELSDESAEDLMLRLKEEKQERCANLFWKVLNQKAASIVYENRITDCPGSLNEHQIGLIVDGKSTRFQFLYTAKINELSPEVRKRWIEIMRTARVSFVND